MLKIQKQMLFWVAIIGLIILFFWLAYYMIFGSMPMTDSITLWNGNPIGKLPFPIPKIFDFLIAPFLICPLIWLYSKSKNGEFGAIEPIISSVFAPGIIFGFSMWISYGIVFGLIHGIISGIVVGFIFGIISGIISELVFCIFASSVWLWNSIGRMVKANKK